MPARPRGLLEPCAATSGTHGSEEGGAGKRRPLSDNKSHYATPFTGKTTARPGQKTARTPSHRSGTLTLGLFRLKNANSIKETTE